MCMKVCVCSKYRLIHHPGWNLSFAFAVVLGVTAERTECTVWTNFFFIWLSDFLHQSMQRSCSSEQEASVPAGIACVWRGLYFPVVKLQNTQRAYSVCLHTPYCITIGQTERGWAFVYAYVGTNKLSSRSFKLLWEVSCGQEKPILKPCNFLKDANYPKR